MGGVILEILTDLRGEFARRREDQGTAGFRGRAFLEIGQIVQDGQDESGRLAGAGLGDTEDIATAQESGNGFSLDRGRFAIARIIEGTQNRVGQAEFGKLGQIIKSFKAARTVEPWQPCVSLRKLA